MTNKMVQNKVMLRINIHEAKAKLSEYLSRVEKGESVLICKRNVPIAELRPLAAPRLKRRVLGGYEGTMTIHSSFFEPLSDELLASFEGRN